MPAIGSAGSVGRNPALRHRFCPIDVMEGQLDRLLGAATMRTARIGVVPFEAARAVKPPLHGFSIYDDREVCVETLTASLTLSEPSEIGAYLELFAGYAKAAVYGAEARAIIARVLFELSAAAD
ncbi:MAG: hypothetical protein GEU83_16715 [Pseudonocardiaceae bacterium]|nr:hypothetical protein [Pseudonocardiaceae bacterium]